MNLINENQDIYSNTKHVYLGWSTNEKVRFEASSGGFTKQFIWYLIDSGEYDYAIITRMNGTEPETIITDKKEDILAKNSNSVYRFHNSIIKLRDIDPNKKYVYTTLPCYVPIVERKYPNVLAITLFCKACPTKGYTDEMNKLMDVRSEQVESIQFRGEGYPGLHQVTLKDGSVKETSFQENWFRSYSHLPKKCRGCTFEPLSSPISVADPWQLNPEDPWNQKGTEKLGKTLIAISDDRSNQLILDAQKSGYIQLEKLSMDQLKQSQGYHLQQKTNNLKMKKNQLLVYAWKIDGEGMNFGEQIPEKILKHLGYEMVLYSHNNREELMQRFDKCYFLIGSNLDRKFVQEFPMKLVIWGTGYTHNEPFDYQDYKNQVSIQMVRGNLTKHALNLPEETPICDPGLLLPLLYDKAEPNGKVLYIPHWENRWSIQSKKDHFKFDEYMNIIFKYDENEFKKFLDKITGAKFVFTNSLHVAVTCVAYDVPFGITVSHNDQLNFPLKWQDFFESVGINYKPVRSLKEGQDWYASVRDKIKLPDLEKILYSFNPE